MSDFSEAPPLDTATLMPRAEAESAIAGFEARITALEGKKNLTFLGDVTVAETLLVSLSLGMKRKTVALAGVVVGDKLLATPNGTPTAGCEVVNAYPASTGNVSIGYYVPALGVAASYSVPVSVYRIA